MVINELANIIFNNYLQNDIEFYIIINGEETTLKKGNLKNFNVKLPFTHYRIESKDKARDYILPIPFAFKFDKELILSYRIVDMVQDKKQVDKLIKMGHNSESKFFNQLIYVRKQLS